MVCSMIKISDLFWISEWRGYEVGLDDVRVVGMYSSKNLEADFYINSEDGEILHIMKWENE